MKTILLLLCLLLTFAGAEGHVCESSGLVDMDLNARWELCVCGERVNETQHVWMPEAEGEQLCSVCGAQQYLWENGTLELCGVDAHGSIARQIAWNAEGDVLMDLSTVYQYDEAGRLLSAWYYDGEVLCSESDFVVGADGYEVEIRATVYNEDGTMSITEYNERGDEILVAFYADGMLESELRYDYTYDADGYMTRMRTFSGETLVEEADFVTVAVEDGIVTYAAKLTAWFEDDTHIVYLNDVNGDTLSESYYDAAGTMVQAYTFETEYDAEGNLLKVTTSENGVVVLVEEYALDAEGWAYCALETIYAADGTMTVTRYDEFGEIIE